MGVNVLRLGGSLSCFIFALLSLVFVALSFSSRDWVHRDYWDAAEVRVEAWTDDKIRYTLYRSPYITCDVNITAVNETASSYAVGCERHQLYGFGRTSCQLPVETNTSAVYSYSGDWRMCQQVHFAGNLLAASLVFACLALALSLPLTIVFAGRSLSKKSDRAVETDSHHADKHHDAGDALSPHHHEPTPKRTSGGVSTALNMAVYLLILSLAVAAVCALLAQFYGVLGLVQSQPDNGSWASLSAGAIVAQADGSTEFHGPWVQGQALTVYASLGWLFGALGAGAIGAFWLRQ